MDAILDMLMRNDGLLLAFIGGISPIQLTILLLLGLLIFGRKLPEVGRGLGRSIVEFRKGIQGIEDEVDAAAKKPSGSTEKTTEHLPSAQSRSDMVQPDGRSVSQEAVSPPRPSSSEVHPASD